MKRWPCAAWLPLAAGVCSLLASCPENATPAGADLKAPCTAVGQRCEFSPGKLGSCVVLDNCQKNDCFVCQSQH